MNRRTGYFADPPLRCAPILVVETIENRDHHHGTAAIRERLSPVGYFLSDTLVRSCAVEVAAIAPKHRGE